MKSCVIQMPRRAAAGGERLLIPTPGDWHVAVWCCWAEPAPAPSHPDPHPVCNAASLPIHAEPRPSVLPQPELAGLTVPGLQHEKKLPLPADVPPRRGFGAAGPLSWLVHLARALRPGFEGCPHGGWGERSLRGAGTAHSEAGQLLWECHECPQYQGLVLWL